MDAVRCHLDGPKGGGVHDIGEIVVVVLRHLLVGKCHMSVCIDEAGKNTQAREVDDLGARRDGDVSTHFLNLFTPYQDRLIGG